MTTQPIVVEQRNAPNLLVRARLSSEMRRLSELMGAVAGGDRVLVERLAAGLGRVDERVDAEEFRDLPVELAG